MIRVHEDPQELQVIFFCDQHDFLVAPDPLFSNLISKLISGQKTLSDLRCHPYHMLLQ